MPNSPVIELFHSIQGEGTYIGTPSLFIRFSKCNLRCFYCDTKFSWTENGKYSIDDAIKFIKENKEYDHVVITGGEPLLYQDEIVKIIGANRDRGRLWTIETNGVISPNDELQELMSFEEGLWSVSPKINILDTNAIIDIVQFYNQLDYVQIKIVICDLKEMAMVQKINKVSEHPMMIQPDGNRQDYDVACRELVDHVNTYRLSDIRVLPQFHRLCWGQRRGL